MQLNPSEISELIKARIADFDATAHARSEGTVVLLTDGIVRIHGLADALQGEMLEFPGEGVNLRTSAVFCDNLRFGLSLHLRFVLLSTP